MAQKTEKTDKVKVTSKAIQTLYGKYRYGNATKEDFMTALVKAKIAGEVTEEDFARMRDDVIADVYIDFSC